MTKKGGEEVKGHSGGNTQHQNNDQRRGGPVQAPDSGGTVPDTILRGYNRKIVQSGGGGKML